MTQISKLILTNFRNFSSKKLEFSSQLVFLFGENGVGKTNILEGLTLIGRSQALRPADFEEMINNESKNGFTVYAELVNHDLIEKLGVAFDLEKKKKLFQVNGEILSNKKQNELKNKLINFIYLTPQIESLFISGKSERRVYLDKIVSDIDVEHQNRINSYQKLLKERLLILQKYKSNDSVKWLDVIENQIVELGMAIASARIETVDFFNKAINSFSSNFPKPQLQIIGDVEQNVMKQSAVLLEENYRQKLKENRNSDLVNFKTAFGVHRSDFDAIFTKKNISAKFCSTGEQKSIMASITLARAKISATYRNQPTILIFDEVASHLDNKRKSDLFEEIKETKLQSFFSATTQDLIPKKYLFQSKNLLIVN
ncbi:MAG: DNA replication and repair protein RecF [Rickettsiales bacterium]|nr:DNA replication and repair protein RecF [Rickettsiales bacterium]